MTINLWLDDERPAPKGWVHVKTVEEAIFLLSYFGVEVENMSLDHDLGQDDTGYTFVKWMAEEKCWPKNKPVVHSMNPVGAANMRSVIDRYGPYGE